MCGCEGIAVVGEATHPLLGQAGAMGFIDRDPRFVGERVLVVGGRAGGLLRMVIRAESGRGGDGGRARGAFDSVGIDRF